MDLVAFYQRLPYPMRVAAASARGWFLDRSRRAPESIELEHQALVRDTWSRATWEARTREQLGALLDFAAREVPFYREIWAERRRQGDRRPWDVLDHWPVLRKPELRRRPEAFLAGGRPTRRLVCLHSSGTTGTPVRLWRDRAANVAWYALFEARVHRWNQVTREDRWAVFGGQLVARTSRNRPPFWVWNAAMGQLYFSSYHLAPRNIPAYVEALRAYRITCIEGYPSSIHAVALAAMRAGLELPEMKVVVTNAEPLFDHQRETIAQAFRCPVRQTYGMTEIAAGASECADGRLHLWPDAGVVEILSADGSPGAPGSVGRIVCTGLLNRAMPLIRYEVGDNGAVGADGPPCACGRSLPVLLQVEGRLDDVIVTLDGRRIGRLDPVFKGDMPIVEAQIVQEASDRVRLRYVPAASFGERDRATLVRRLGERLGAMQIVLEPVEAIERSANGKFRAVISLIAPVAGAER